MLSRIRSSREISHIMLILYFEFYRKVFILKFYISFFLLVPRKNTLYILGTL